MYSLRNTAKLLDPTTQVISTRHIAQMTVFQPPISLLHLMSIWVNKVENVEQSLSFLKKSGTLYIFKGECKGLSLPYIPLVGSNSHVQGVASYKDYLILTHSSESKDAKTGSIIILNQKSLKIVNKMNTPEGYNHPGGIQQIGNYLAVSLEHHPDVKTKESCIRFYDLSRLSDTQLPILLGKPIIYRGADKAGAVGVTSYIENGIEKLVLAVNDGGNVVFYKSNERLLSDPECVFEIINNEPFKINGDIQNICLVTDKQEKIYMIAFKSAADDLGLPVVDYVDLYLIDITTKKISTIISNIHFICDHGTVFPGTGVHFRWGAGIRVVSPQKIEVLATKRNIFPIDIVIPNRRWTEINKFPSQ
jgi:hypothetical protein